MLINNLRLGKSKINMMTRVRDSKLSAVKARNKLDLYFSTTTKCVLITYGITFAFYNCICMLNPAQVTFSHMQDLSSYINMMFIPCSY